MGIPRLRARAAVLLAVALAVGVLAWTVADGMRRAQLIGTDPDATPADPATMRYAVDRGRDVFKTNCASCHGPDGQGRRSLGAANLTDRDWLYGEGAVSDIEKVVLYGIRAPNNRSWKLADMPAYATPQPYPRDKSMNPLAPQEIRDLVHYLRKLRGAKAEPEAAARGAAIFADRGRCYDCHSDNGRGDTAVGAPNLTDDIWLYGDGSDKSQFDSIADGRAGICPAWFGRLKPVPIRQVSLYVYSLSHGSAKPTPSLP